MTIDPALGTVTRALTLTYLGIWQHKMRDVPVTNPRLNVEAVDFRIWQGFYLGVLITPWFMNLVLVPRQQADWSDRITGEKYRYGFEAGEFEFILGRVDGIGSLLSCSLFSPVFEFDDHATAVATARAVMNAVFDPTTGRADQPRSSDSIGQPTADRAGISTETLSRRDFFRGRFSGSASQLSQS